MEDIVEKLRQGARQRRLMRDIVAPGMLIPHTDLMDSAADEIERLRTPATQATAGRGSVQDGCTLTDEEREAVAGAADLLIGSKPGSALRKLLERLHT